MGCRTGRQIFGLDRVDSGRNQRNLGVWAVWADLVLLAKLTKLTKLAELGDLGNPERAEKTGKATLKRIFGDPKWTILMSKERNQRQSKGQRMR